MRGVNENGGADALPLVVTITVKGTALPELCDTDGFRGLVRMPTRSKLE
jgi:hypothetical protein